MTGDPAGIGCRCWGIRADLAMPAADHPDFREEWRL